MHKSIKLSFNTLSSIQSTDLFEAVILNSSSYSSGESWIIETLSAGCYEKTALPCSVLAYKMLYAILDGLAKTLGVPTMCGNYAIDKIACSIHESQ